MKNLIYAGETLGLSDYKNFFGKLVFSELFSGYCRRNNFGICEGFRRVRSNDYACGKYSGENADGSSCGICCNAKRKSCAGVPVGGGYGADFVCIGSACECCGEATDEIHNEEEIECLFQSISRKKMPDFTLDVSFEAENEFFAVLGESGCGKSLTLRCIAGIETPDEGRIVLNNRVLFDSERKINLSPKKRKIGYLFQDYALFPNMTVEENYRDWSWKEKEERGDRTFY